MISGRRLHLLAIGALGLALLGQAPPATFEVEELVTAVDLMVSVRERLARKAPPAPEAGDFEVLVAGTARPIVDVASASEDGLNRWAVVILLDEHLASTSDLRWGASALANHATALTTLGPVTIIRLGDTPATLLAASPDPTLVRSLLTRLGLEAEGEHALFSHRLAFVQAREMAEEDPDQLAAAYLAEERRLLQEREDELLATLLAVDTSAPARVVFAVTGPLDPPATNTFYNHAGAVSVDDEEGPSEEIELVGATLAGYGWTLFSLRPPPPEVNLKRGLREAVIGTWEGDRDPEKARALYELGLVLARQGHLDRAAEAYTDALHHFYKDPRTAKEQAATLWELGVVRELVGDSDGAHRAFLLAGQLDPIRARPATILLEDLAADRSPQALSRATGGGAVATSDDLAAALNDLRRRVRVTYQLSGDPDGELLPLQIRFHGRTTSVTGPQWARTSTPERVAEANLRRASRTLDLIEAEGGPFEAEVTSADSVTWRLTVRSTEGAEWKGARRLRVSWAVVTPDPQIPIRHEMITVGSDWSHSALFPAVDAEVLVAVQVEDLVSGRQGMRLVEPEIP